MNTKKTIHIISGGTMSPIATHLGLHARAFGTTGRKLQSICGYDIPELEVVLHETKMVTGGRDNERRNGTWYDGQLETNDDVKRLIRSLKNDLSVKIVFMPVALCDFDVKNYNRFAEEPGSVQREIGKNATRLKTSDGDIWLHLTPAEKLIPTVRQGRKDIFLVGFKTTDGVSEDEMYIAGLNLLKEGSCNLVLANDVKTKMNMVITPEEARYHVTEDRYEALKGLVEMAKLRSHLTFTRSTVIAGEPIQWEADIVPPALRKVVDYCIEQNAYKPFRGATVGHFAAKLAQDTFITSQRKTNFNDLKKIGLVLIKTDGPDTVLAYGAKPSVGGQSQRIVFNEHPEFDCIVHFHCPLSGWGKDGVPVVSQREYECGSHQCGQNTSRGLKLFRNGQIACVMLDQHGPNIVFNSKIDPQVVIEFIEENFNLTMKTGGYVTLPKPD